MSVVNKMLRDLEQRETSMDSASADYQPPSRSKLSPPVVAILILFITGAALLLWRSPAQWQTMVNAAAVQEKDSQQKGTQENQPLQAELAKQKMPQDPLDTIQQQDSAFQLKASVESTKDKGSQPQAEVITQAVLAARSAPPQVLQAPLPEPTPELSSEPSSEQTAAQENGRFLVSQSPAAVNPMADLKRHARQALQKGNASQALVYLQQLLELEPDNINARKKLAALLFSQKHQRQASSVLEQGLKIHPDNPELRLMLARLRYQQGQPAEALLLLQQRSPAVTRWPKYIGFRAALAEQAQKFELAAQDYHALLSADASNPRWWLGYAVSQDRLKNVKPAYDAYRHVLDDSSMNPEVLDFVHMRLTELAGGL